MLADSVPDLDDLEPVEARLIVCDPKLPRDQDQMVPTTGQTAAHGRRNQSEKSPDGQPFKIAIGNR